MELRDLRYYECGNNSEKTEKKEIEKKAEIQAEKEDIQEEKNIGEKNIIFTAGLK